MSPEGGGSSLQPGRTGHLLSGRTSPESGDLPTTLPYLVCHRSRQVGWEGEARRGAGSLVAAPGLAQEALPFSGSSPYELLKLIYDGPAQACGFCA